MPKLINLSEDQINAIKAKENKCFSVTDSEIRTAANINWTGSFEQNKDHFIFLEKNNTTGHETLTLLTHDSIDSSLPKKRIYPGYTEVIYQVPKDKLVLTENNYYVPKPQPSHSSEQKALSNAKKVSGDSCCKSIQKTLSGLLSACGKFICCGSSSKNQNPLTTPLMSGKPPVNSM